MSIRQGFWEIKQTRSRAPGAGLHLGCSYRSRQIRRVHDGLPDG
jgi:hypothetical protein